MAGRRIIPPIGRPVSTDAQAAGCLPPSVPGDSLFHPNFHDDDKECRYRIADIGSLRAIRGCVQVVFASQPIPQEILENLFSANGSLMDWGYT